MLCIKCGGTGEYLGNGMIITNCNACDGESFKKKTITSKTPINRKSKSYQDAIKDIMAINPDISREDAVKMFDKAYNKD